MRKVLLSMESQEKYEMIKRLAKGHSFKNADAQQACIVLGSSSLLASLYRSANIVRSFFIISAFFSSHTPPRFSPIPFAVKLSTMIQTVTSWVLAI